METLQHLNSSDRRHLLARARKANLKQRYNDEQPISVIDRSGALPLSLAQQRLWFLSRMSDASEAYHISGGVRLIGELDREALRAALERIVQRHESLRTRFEQLDGQALQVIDGPQVGWSVREHDLRGVNDPQGELQALSKQEGCNKQSQAGGRFFHFLSAF